MIKDKKAFTLIEVLIVISLSSILTFTLINIFNTSLESFKFSKESIFKQQRNENIVLFINNGLDIGVKEIKDKKIIFKNNEEFYLYNNKIYFGEKIIAYKVNNLEITLKNNILEVLINNEKKFIFFYK